MKKAVFNEEEANDYRYNLDEEDFTNHDYYQMEEEIDDASIVNPEDSITIPSVKKQKV